jgi:hypothetical protein
VATGLRLRRLLPVLLVLSVGIAASWNVWRAPVQWTPDGVFYQAQLLELRGADAKVARQSLAAGPVGASASALGGHLDDPAVVEATAPFYRRRWLVPAVAAGISPVFGERSILLVSLLGYLATGGALYLLLRRRVAPWPSAVAAASCLLLVPMRMWSFFPLTDSAAIALLAVALVLASRAFERGGRWIPLWALSVAALSVTRDSALVAVAAAAWIAVRERTRRAVGVAVAGLMAALPVLVLFGAPLRTQMDYVFLGRSSPDDSWSEILAGYWPSMHTMLQSDIVDVGYYRATFVILAGLALLFLRPRTADFARIRAVGLSGVAAYAALMLVSPGLLGEDLPVQTLTIAGLVLLLRAGADRDARLLRAGAFAALAYLCVLPNMTDFRLELTLVPFAAAGLTFAIARSLRRPAPAAAPVAAAAPAAA